MSFGGNHQVSPAWNLEIDLLFPMVFQQYLLGNPFHPIQWTELLHTFLDASEIWLTYHWHQILKVYQTLHIKLPSSTATAPISWGLDGSPKEFNSQTSHQMDGCSCIRLFQMLPPFCVFCWCFNSQTTKICKLNLLFLLGLCYDLLRRFANSKFCRFRTSRNPRLIEPPKWLERHRKTSNADCWPRMDVKPRVFNLGGVVPI